ncbi:MAG: tetratricopeptide repeat protein [Minicystis sp.]
MKRLLSCGFPAALALAAVTTLVACAGEEPPKAPVLTADPPVESAADDGAVQTELERGIAYVKNEKFAEAKDHFKKAISIKPTPTAWTYLGVTAEKTGDRAGAEDAYKNALKLDSGFAEAAENLSALYLDDPPRPDEAIAILKPAIDKTKDNARLLQNLGFAYGLKGDLEAASKAYDAALAKGEDARTRFAYGALLHEKKQPEKAAEQLRKAVDAAKDDAALIASAGRLLGATKAFGDCVKAFDKAIGLKGSEPEFFVRRGTCKHELKDEDGAQKDYEAAIKSDPKFAAGHYYLGLSFLSQKKRLFATRELEKAAELGKDSPIGKAAKDKLDDLNTKKKK